MFWELLARLALSQVARQRTTEVARERIFYRTTDGYSDYGFDIERQPDRRYRIYIFRQPPYGRRRSDGATTHRLRDGFGRAFICWSRPIHHHRQARAVAAAWAEATNAYIRTGREF